jgi:phosphate transport system permease protein
LNTNLTTKGKRNRTEFIGKAITFLCIALIVVIVCSIFFFIANYGLTSFISPQSASKPEGVNFFNFLFSSTWNPANYQFGALPMFLGSIGVTLIAALFATPFAIAAAIFMVEIAPKAGSKILQPVIELLVGIPSVVYGFIGASILVPFMRGIFGGSGQSILAGAVVLFVMILPTVTTMSIDSLKAVPRNYREASLALGATRWQTIWKVVLRASTSGIMTAVVFGMARAFGEALAVQMVIGNMPAMPQGLTTPASTLTSILTMGISNQVPGTVQYNILWSLALLLLFMALVFNIIIRLIGRKGAMK